MGPPGYEQNLLTYAQFQNVLRTEFARARRYEHPLSCLALQVDRLDHLRDLYGVPLKNEIFERVLRLIQGQTRSSDAVGCFGDRVFLLLPHTDLEGARVAGQRLVEKVAQITVRHRDKELQISVSVGVASCTDKGAIFYDALLKSAQEALSTAAGSGGNRVEVVPGAPVPGTDTPLSPAVPLVPRPQPTRDRRH